MASGNAGTSLPSVTTGVVDLHPQTNNSADSYANALPQGQLVLRRQTLRDTFNAFLNPFKLFYDAADLIAKRMAESVVPSHFVPAMDVAGLREQRDSLDYSERGRLSLAELTGVKEGGLSVDEEAGALSRPEVEGTGMGATTSRSLPPTSVTP